MNRLLFVNQSQFGYHIDYLEYCKNLKDDYKISYICWDFNKPKIEIDDVSIIYLNRSKNILIRNLLFIIYAIKFIYKNNFNNIFIHYFRGCSLISLFISKKKKIHLDIRSGYISNSILKRFIFNLFIRFESHFFTSISIISESLKKYLQINKETTILPLGANPILIQKDCSYKLHLIYVGTFSNRKIETTIFGVYKFLKKFPESDIHYTIIGSGWKNEEEKLKCWIKILDLEKQIELVGYIPNHMLNNYFSKVNVGLSFVPITQYFDCQPPTKTFEYLMAGLPVIATNTKENSKIINSSNGLIINDDEISLCNALNIMYETIDNYNYNEIKDSVSENTWENISKIIKTKILNESSD